MSNHNSLGAGRVCVSPPGLSKHTPSPDGCGHHPIPLLRLLPPRGPFPAVKQNRLVAWGGSAVGNWGSDRELLGWALDWWEMAISSCWGHYSGLRADSIVVRMKLKEESEQREDKKWAEAREGEERGSL